MQTGDTNYIYKNCVGKAYFAHDASYSDSKDLTKRTAVDKTLTDKAFEIANDLKHNGYERGLAAMVHTFLNKKQKQVILKMKLNKINN